MAMVDIKRLISVAKGDSPADLILAHAKIVNTLSGDIEEGDVAVCQGVVAGIGDYRDADRVVDIRGKYLVPGLIDGHIHPESSMLHIARYAEAVVPRGVSAIVTDLHEISNVKGLNGAKYMIDCAESLPLDLHFMVPSCVPATHLETAGAELNADDIAAALSWQETIGLGEMMNFPGVLFADEGVLAKIEAARGRVIDGHAPGLGGRNLNAYIACGIGSDHECTVLAEAEEKLQRGMHIMIREGSSEKNLEALLPLVTDRTYSRCMFVIDDRSCADLLRDGDIDAVVRKAIALGLEPVRAIQMATINTANYFRLARVGAIAPGYLANMMVTADLAGLEADQVYYHGSMVAEHGAPLFAPSILRSEEMAHTMNVKPFTMEALMMPSSMQGRPVIGVVPDQIVTKRLDVKARVENDCVVADVEQDILKLAVVERHRASGNIGLGLVQGIGLRDGALASSIAHDSHNIVAVGANDSDLYTAVMGVVDMGGGLAVAAGGDIVAALPLPVAGLLSDRPLQEVVSSFEGLKSAASGLGATLGDPFATLSFLALPVIPELRLTDKGLVDVMQFKVLE